MGAFVAGGAFEALEASLPGVVAKSLETVFAGDIAESLGV